MTQHVAQASGIAPALPPCLAGWKDEAQTHSLTQEHMSAHITLNIYISMKPNVHSKNPSSHTVHSTERHRTGYSTHDPNLKVRLESGIKL